MSICKRCMIREKVVYCCSSHPETGESVALKSNQGVVNACPELTRSGRCGTYEFRPSPCKDYQCPKISEMDLVELLRFE